MIANRVAEYNRRKIINFDSLQLPTLSMLTLSKPSQINLKLPKINNKFLKHMSNHYNKTPPPELINKTQPDLFEYQEDDSAEVSKLDQWSMNKPTKKCRKPRANHNLSFIYQNSTIRPTKPTQYGNNYKFMDVQIFIAKIDNQLQKISQTNYFSIYKNMQYCSGVYENSFNNLLNSIAKYKLTVETELNQILLKLQTEREEHIKKVQELQQNNNNSYKDQINQVRELLEEKQQDIKPLKKILSKIQAAKIKVLKFCLSLGYDVREEGLLWIIKQLGVIPKPQEFPSFLSDKQINFIINKFTIQQEASNAQNLMKTQICGKSINEAYEYVNRRKRRQLSLIKENEQLEQLYANRIKDYSRQKHTYLSDSTLQIAKQIEKQKPKPTRYEIIYKQTIKKLNRICRQKIHPHIYLKANKENQKLPKQQLNEKQVIRRRQKKKSTIIIEEFGKMLDLSINQSKKLDEIYTKQEKQFEEILREIRQEKYTQSGSHRVTWNKFDQSLQENKLRNPISILSCLLGWKKAEKIIEQEMFGF